MGQIYEVPCGRCFGCRLDNARDWAVRAVHEAQLHDENMMITLTYNEDNIPKDGSVNKAELVKFCKRLRRKIEPRKISYFGCGEYGEKFSRPHYHILIFGYNFPDRYNWKYRNPKWGNRFSTANGYWMQRSPTLEKLWKFGYSSVGEITIESAGYVSRYVRKKISGEISLKHYNGKAQEFAIMSKRPALGKEWLRKHLTDVYPKDFFHIDGKRYKPPRYYDKLLMRWDWSLYEGVKTKRLLNMIKEDNPRLMQKQKHSRLVTSSLERGYEVGKQIEF